MDADETGETPWCVWLRPANSLLHAGIGALSVWPITRGENHGQDALDDLRQGRPVDLGIRPLIDLTRFLACRLSDATRTASALFSIGLVIEGLPVNRHAAILRSIINSRDAFFRYLRLLLSELGDPFGAAFAAQNSANYRDKLINSSGLNDILPPIRLLSLSSNYLAK
jgi:hypothetical protein